MLAITTVSSAISSSGVVNTGQQMLTRMGIHPLSFGGLFGQLNNFIATVYQGTVTFSVEYGVMILVLSTLVWMIAWKFHLVTAANWAKRLMGGVFMGEIIVVLVPQLYFGLILLLSKI